jgi:ABC-2 type transport system permease protein
MAIATVAAPLTKTAPPSRLAADLRAIKVVWKREMIRFVHDRMRLVTSLVQPILYLFVLGTGLSSLTGLPSNGAVTLRTFMFPGVLALGVVFTAMFSAGSIVWDREFGFLREMLVAPVGRGAIVIGKCLGGATVSTLQGSILIAIAGLNGVPYSIDLILEMVGLLLLLSFTMTAFGVFLAARMKTMQSFFGVMQMVTMPMFFLSGALYPLSTLPGWLTVLTRINPLTYAVDPLRKAVFAHVNASGPVFARFKGGLDWFGWQVPVALEVFIVFAIGVAMLGFAVLQFRRAD